MITSKLQLFAGEPLSHAALSIFPVLGHQASKRLEYLLSDEALDAGILSIEEISEAGSVPVLLVKNLSDFYVMLIEGEELSGAKQDRVLNTSICVAAHSTTKIPVTCVEQGRWSDCTRAFSSTQRIAPSRLRYLLKQSVSESTLCGRGHTSDQRGVWQSISSTLSSFQIDSATSSLSDVYESLDTAVTDQLDQFPYVQGATGLAVAIDGRLRAIDLFDKPQTCCKLWPRLLTGHIVESLEAGSTRSSTPSKAEVDAVLHQLSRVEWKRETTIGKGQEFRGELPGGHPASMLTFRGNMLHASAVMAA